MGRCQVLINACDGLWDEVTDQEAIDMVYRVCSRGESLLRRNAQSCYTCFQFYSTRPVFGIRIAPGAAVELAARKLRDEALDKGSMDNISVMVTLLRPIPQHPNEVLAFFSGTCCVVIIYASLSRWQLPYTPSRPCPLC